MVIQTRIHDGISIKTRTYRNIPYDRRGLWRFQAGFMAQKEYSRWGIMTILRGKNRQIVAKFGKIVYPTKIPIIDKSTTYVGRFVETIDTYDGVAGDEDYEAYDYKYLSLELEILK